MYKYNILLLYNQISGSLNRVNAFKFSINVVNLSSQPALSRFETIEPLDVSCFKRLSTIFLMKGKFCAEFFYFFDL